MSDPLSSTRRLIIVTVIIVVIILIGLLTMVHPRLKYVLSAEESLTEILNPENQITPGEVLNISEKSEAGYMIIDLRNPVEYNSGHIDGAINIPAPTLLSDQHIDQLDGFLKDSLQVILYGKNQLEANGPWILLKQLGYNNLKIMPGGYSYLASQPDINNTQEKPAYMAEEAAYDFAGIIKQSGNPMKVQVDPAEPEIIIPARKKKTNVVEGGC